MKTTDSRVPYHKKEAKKLTIHTGAPPNGAPEQ